MNYFEELPDHQNKNQKGYDLKYAVKLPNKEDPNEWIAYYLFGFHKQIRMLYDTVSDECTPQNCPCMTAGKKYVFSWSDDPGMKVSASYYINRILDWVQEQLDDEDVFPSKSIDKPFPQNFQSICQAIARRLYRVFAHIYHHHLGKVKYLKEEAHMNTNLKHYIYFVKEFELITEEELEPLQEFIDKMEIVNRCKSPTTA